MYVYVNICKMVYNVKARPLLRMCFVKYILSLTFSACLSLSQYNDLSGVSFMSLNFAY